MAVSADSTEHQLKQAATRVRLLAGDTELEPGERFTAAVLSLPAAGTAVETTVVWTVLSAPEGPVLEPGSAFVAPRGLAGTQVELIFRPETIERIPQPIVPLRRIVRATVTLAAGGKSVTRNLQVEVRARPLAVPSVLAMFRSRDFDGGPEGAALVVVPAGSPLTTLAAARTALGELLAAADRLSLFGRFATFATRLRILTQALAEQPAAHVQFRRADAIARLNRITLIQRGALQNDTEAEDELSSLILLGPTARRARLFVRRNLDPAAGRLDVTVGDENIVLVGNLHARRPATTPAGAAAAVVEPPGERTFGDELSSLELLPPQLLSTLAGQATLEINHPQAGRDDAPISVVLAFSGDHRTLTIDSFPPIVGELATVTLVDEAAGTFDPGTGAMTIAARLHLATGIAPVEIPFTLTTGTASEGIYTETGEPMDPDSGAIRLVGAARAEGIIAAEAKAVIEAALDPIP